MNHENNEMVRLAELPSSNEEKILQKISDLQKLIAQNKSMEDSLVKEPKNVLTKMYIEGTPTNLKNTISTIFNSYCYDSNGKPMDRTLAVTLMIEDKIITKK